MAKERIWTSTKIEEDKAQATIAQIHLRSILVEHLHNYGPRDALHVLEGACADLQEERLGHHDPVPAKYWRELGERIHEMEA